MRSHICPRRINDDETVKAVDEKAGACMVTVEQEDNWFVATDVRSGVASQGKTREEAIENLMEALDLYYGERMDYRFNGVVARD